MDAINFELKEIKNLIDTLQNNMALIKKTENPSAILLLAMISIKLKEVVDASQHKILR